MLGEIILLGYLPLLVFRKIKKDFQAALITMDDQSIRDVMQKSLENAKIDFKK